MMKRIAIAFAAMVMWVLFGIEVWIAFIAFPVLCLAWIFNSSDWLQQRLTSYGQALDSCANVVFMDGHPKETISSHVGRFYEARYGNPYKGREMTRPDLVMPWQALFVKWLTDFAETDHVLKAVEQWAIDANVAL